MAKHPSRQDCSGQCINPPRHTSSDSCDERERHEHGVNNDNEILRLITLLLEKYIRATSSHLVTPTGRSIGVEAAIKAYQGEF